MSISFNVSNGVQLEDWIKLLAGLEKNDEKRMLFCLAQNGRNLSYHLYTRVEVQSVVDRDPCIQRLIAYGLHTRQYCAGSRFSYFYKFSYEDMTTQNELIINWMRDIYLTPAHFKAVKDNFVKNIQSYSFEALFNAELSTFNTIINAQHRMQTQAVKHRCCIKKIICFVQNIFIKLLPSWLNSVLRYTFFLPFINIDCWNARFTLEEFRQTRKAFAQGILGQFREEITSLIGKEDVKKWIAQNHPDKNKDPSIQAIYTQVDTLRQLIDHMNRKIESIDNPTTPIQSQTQEAPPPEEKPAPAATPPIPDPETSSVELPD
jgi:predicted transcriptional regulator